MLHQLLGMVTRKDLVSLSKLSMSRVRELQQQHSPLLICLPQDLRNPRLGSMVARFIEASK